VLGPILIDPVLIGTALRDAARSGRESSCAGSERDEALVRQLAIPSRNERLHGIYPLYFHPTDQNDGRLFAKSVYHLGVPRHLQYCPARRLVSAQAKRHKLAHLQKLARLSELFVRFQIYFRVPVCPHRRKRAHGMTGTSRTRQP
jgi:hypothetical protein